MRFISLIPHSCLNIGIGSRITPEYWHWGQDNAIAELIALNGNHWRKIFTIMAKTCTPSEDWRHYRDNLLLKKHEMLLIGASALSPHASIHIVCEQAAAKLSPQALSKAPTSKQYCN